MKFLEIGTMVVVDEGFEPSSHPCQNSDTTTLTRTDAH